ncbi:MAG: helix-turn-helix domain-containing protein [Clostridiales bacterium]|nr:helix-turn-helix domain-containing protein [Clostridiales bacterium]
MDMGNKIRKLRYKASLTQEQLAERLGVSAQAVSKWENAVAMPDITLLPQLAEVFGISIDELFDLTVEQKLLRIQNRMDVEDELPPDVFREYESFLKEMTENGAEEQRAVSLLAHLYHHRLESVAKKTARYARRAILHSPGTKECQWLLQKAEGGVAWDWNIANHSGLIAFYKQQVDGEGAQLPLPYSYLLDHLIADHRTQEAETYLKRYAELPGHRPFMVKVYEAAIALARYDEPEADAIMAKALEVYEGESGMLFEAAQYYARKCDYEKAIHYYEASFAAEEAQKPRFYDALEGVATIYEILGEYRKAADTWERILALLREEWGFTEETIIAEARQKINELVHMQPQPAVP